jgi:hypothetical protein
MKRGIVCVASAVSVLYLWTTPVAAQPVQPTLPQTFNTEYPTQTGQIRTVNSGQDIQAAINAALPGDTIMLQAGATFALASTLHLVAKSNPNQQWIVIRSASTMFDPGGAVPPGTRVNGTDTAQTGQMAKILAPSTGPVIKTDQSSGTLIAGYYRLVGLEITADPAVGDVTNLVELGSATETVAANQASFVTIDRCYIHGGSDTLNYRRGVALNGSYVAIIDSYFSNFHDVNTDAQAASGWNGPGPIQVVNNYLEAATENLIFGGSDPAIQNLIPSDIEVRRNFMTKNTAKRGASGYTVKNVFELKNAQRVLLDGNILEYSWEDGQVGYLMLMTSRNQSGGCPWCVVRDVTVTNNIFRHGTGLLQILAFDDTHPSGQMQRVAIRNNLTDDVNSSWFKPTNCQPGFACNSVKYLLIRGGGSPTKSSVGATDLTFDHNTFIGEMSHMVVFGDNLSTTTYQTIQGFQFTKNLIKRKANANAAYGIEGVGVSSPGTAALNAYAPGYIFTDNGIGNVTASQYPTGNQYPDLTTWEGQFVNYNGGVGGDYHLIANNIYAQAGNGDVGADLTAIDNAINGVGACNTTGVLLTDTFDDNSICSAWSPGVPLSGTTVDSTVHVTETNQRLEIGPLNQNPTGASYNGMRSTATYDFTGASMYVQLIQPPATGTTDAWALVAIGKDSNNYYRWEIGQGNITVLKKMAGGAKQPLHTEPYNATNHQFLRVRHSGTSVIFETAPNNNGSPGTWAPFYSEAWDTTNLPVTAVAFELKAGSTNAQPVAPGTVVFDNFSATRP